MAGTNDAITTHAGRANGHACKRRVAFLWSAAALSAVYVLQGKRRMKNTIVSVAFLLLALLQIIATAAKHGEPF